MANIWIEERDAAIARAEEAERELTAEREQVVSWKSAFAQMVEARDIILEERDAARAIAGRLFWHRWCDFAQMQADNATIASWSAEV
jgi:hypothetical protein